MHIPCDRNNNSQFQFTRFFVKTNDIDDKCKHTETSELVNMQIVNMVFTNITSYRKAPEPIYTWRHMGALSALWELLRWN